VYQVYLFCLVLAGGLSLLSVFGDVADTDLVDIDIDADVGLDASAEGDLGSGFDWARVLSLRGFLYAAFGFGLAGALQVWLLDAPPAGPVTVGTAIVGGLATGMLVDQVTGLIRSVSTPDREGDDGFEGCTGKILVPLREDAAGRVRVTRGGRTFDIRALPHGRPDSDPAEWNEVVVVEMRDGFARVVPSDDLDLQLPS